MDKHKQEIEQLRKVRERLEKEIAKTRAAIDLLEAEKARREKKEKK